MGALLLMVEPSGRRRHEGTIKCPALNSSLTMMKVPNAGWKRNRRAVYMR